MDEYLKRWLLLALEDLKIARHEISQPKEEMATIGVCFHAQQAAEKCLKAYLVSRSAEFEKTHSLEYLIKLCTKEDKKFSTLNVGNLTDYAVQVRYPDDFFIPSVNEAKRCLKLAENIKDFVLQKLKISEEELK